ncbi:MAG: tRNA (adenosine(37)-N6)-threonylcarbamoyltransferase complex dimerization subunit type 1 TsaB [Acidimicrobiia bacterium]|nr:tRNA (adenosine(37)-N6)-threonylcarbamoyltransferase complex dimerization subunit type 1 TsaB [Acidimicrobiia bacterium]
MITLGLSSSTALVGVAVAANERVLAEQSTMTDRRHAEEITPMLQAVLAAAATDLSEVERIVVDVGPGRYTGMRVGIATAKTLAFALDVAVVPVTSFQLLAAAAPPHDGPLFAVVDARRNQVFAANVFDGSEPLVLSPAELAALLPADALCVGDGADRYGEQLGCVASLQRDVVPSVAAAALWDPSAAAVASSSLEPLYLREPDAAINIKTRPGGVKRA